MAFLQVWGALVIFIVCPLLGGLPLIDWLVRGLTGQQLAQIGTGNISVSAAFYHGGRLVGILAVISEAFKGIAAVLMTRSFFPSDPTWELIALIALVMGRYWMGRGAGTTNVVWGMIVHDWATAGLLFLISGISFTIIRQRQHGRQAVLILLPILMGLLHPEDGARIVATVILCVLLAWIYQTMPDDLDLPVTGGKADTQTEFRFFRGDRAIRSLAQKLEARKVGQKAATLSQLKCWGYPVPMGWVLPAGDDSQPLVEWVQPSPQAPVVVRSSAVGEDSDSASAAGIYDSILHVKSPAELEQALAKCFASYDRTAAIQYRQDRGVADTTMSVLVQQQVQGVFSGVAFSRDPIARQGEAVVIEALPGAATQVVSGQVTPEQYQVQVPDIHFDRNDHSPDPSSWVLPSETTLEITGIGMVPSRLIQQVAFLVRHLETRYHGIPQDIEWSYDGHNLWLLQARPITTLLPIWTRKIAAEVIPGLIRPLTWSVNQPLTCGVWGKIFTIVLGQRVGDLDFKQTATLHHARAYFNASLLGQIFRRMGLPPESLEFLTRGAKFSKPPLKTTLRNVPGLLRLMGRELKLERDFQRDNQLSFKPALTDLAALPVEDLSTEALLERVESLLVLLDRITYYSILAPLSLAIRQAIFQIGDQELDNRQSPEIASLRDLQDLAVLVRTYLNPSTEGPMDRTSLLAALASSSEGQVFLHQLDQILDRYGYLSEVGTDIAVPTWKEDPHPVHELLTQFVHHPPQNTKTPAPARNWKTLQVQRRLDLKGRVTAVYSRSLAELRWSFVAMAQRWQASGILSEVEDIFYLELDEIRQLITDPNSPLSAQVQQLIANRQSRLEQQRQMTTVPSLIYGNTPPTLMGDFNHAAAGRSANVLRGIGASAGQVEGQVKVLLSLQAIPDLEPNTILIVPYTDSGWAPLLARAAGLIAEVGGRLSHGAIVAREYGIPAVMDIAHATQQLQDGQTVRLDGQQGIVEILG